MTDNQDSGVTMDKQAPPTDRPLTAGDVPLTDQCRVVVHFANGIASVFSDYAKLAATGVHSTLYPIWLARSADLIETLGNILNDMDAVTDEDDWTAPIVRASAQYQSRPATSAASEGEGVSAWPEEMTPEMEQVWRSAFISQGHLRRNQPGRVKHPESCERAAYRALRKLIAKAAIASQPVSEREREGELERDRFEAWYCQDAAVSGLTFMPTEIASLRDGNGYGKDRTALNSKWEGWSARAQPQETV